MCNSVKTGSNSCQPCSIGILVDIDTNKNNLTELAVSKFICTFSISCKNNVEFMEYSNEIIFFILANKTDYFLSELSKKSKTYINFVYEQLSSPLNDYDLYILEQKIKDSKSGTVELRNKMVEALLRAK